MTTYGGTKNKGVLFKYDPVHNVFEKKVDFIVSNGQEPYGSLTACSNWKLYGMTRNGGNDNYGVLFEYDPFNDTLIKKVDFADSIGILTEGSLLEASNGKLYGMTNMGGTHDGGVLFEYNPITSSYAKKIDFTGATNGRYPEGTLIQAKNGLLYGTTAQGGIYDNGVLFEYDPVTNNLVKKIDFDGTNIGSLPYGALFQADDGKLYGMTSYGGVYDSGVLFSYEIASGVLTKLLDYNGDSTGYRPRGTLMQAVNGKLYGTTCCGGIWSGGTLFEYDIQTNKFVKKEDFNQINGYTPTWGQLIEIGGMVGIAPIIPPENDQGISVYPNPSNGKFTISLKDDESIKIYNTMGMEIYNGQYQRGENNLVLDLPNGIYILKAWNGKASSSVKISIFN